MWVLALDTTTRDGSVALVRDDDVVVERAGDPAWSHAERLPTEFQVVLAEAGLSLGAIDLIAVATGPGGFTGLRIGLAAAQGLALALDRPAAGVPTLATLAWQVLEARPDAATVGAWLEASRGEVFAAAYRPPSPDRGPAWPLADLAPPTAASPLDTAATWRGVVPPGSPLAGACSAAAIAVAVEAGYDVVATTRLLAGSVGRLAWRAHLRDGSHRPNQLAPVYVRRPDVEIERDRRRADRPAC